MPVFDFRCTSCGTRTEHILLSNEARPKTCDRCGGDLVRAWGGSRIRISFEGWGFSRNDLLLPGDRPRRDWKALKERADRLRDE